MSARRTVAPKKTRSPSGEAYDALLLCLKAIDQAPHDYVDDLGSHNPDRCNRCVAWFAAKRASGRLLALHDARTISRLGGTRRDGGL
jgi:hypothetical protein